MSKYLLFALVILVGFKVFAHPMKQFQRINGKAQGTTYSIVFDGKSSTFSKYQADSIFKVIDLSMSLWDKNSIISKFNDSNSEAQEIDFHFQKVLLKSFEIYKISEGAFDPTVAPLIKSWGFISKNNLPLPSKKTIDSLKQFVGLEKVSLKENRISKQNPAIQLDFNAIAQGYTVDVLAEFLEKKGVKNYLIEVGGEVRAKGKNSQGKIWRIGIEKPFLNETDEQNELQLILGLANVSLATSGNYRNYIENQGKRIGHILDPKTGKPVEHQVISVSVLAPTCAEADAWATAFTVLGKEKSIELSKRLGLEIQVVSLNGDNFEVFQTDGFQRQIQKK